MGRHGLHETLNCEAFLGYRSLMKYESLGIDDDDTGGLGKTTHTV
jgi:hypothetical protein